MMDPALETIDRAPPAGHDASVIWLHGLGADGHDFAPIVDELRLPARHGIRFVFPHAPRRPVTLNAGMTMPAWYDVTSLDRSGDADEPGIRAAASQIEGLIARERGRGVASERIVLAGFSQGAALALHTGLRHGHSLAGIIALSAYLPLGDRLAAQISPANHDTPIFQAHGDGDEVLPLALARASYERIAAVRSAPEWHLYPGMGHGVCAQEITDLRAWLSRTLGPG
jgi:phospholipase/carboxylesterase